MSQMQRTVKMSGPFNLYLPIPLYYSEFSLSILNIGGRFTQCYLAPLAPLVSQGFDLKKTITNK